jgi:hypothetical protein
VLLRLEGDDKRVGFTTESVVDAHFIAVSSDGARDHYVRGCGA